ncbi:MAG: type 4a pilus biogenesis protein PilO [Candidatus Omnitrophota bacterium]
MMKLDFLKQKKIIIYLLIIITVLAIDILFIIKPQILTIKKISPEINKLSADLKAFEEDKKNLNQLKASFEILNKKSIGLDKRIIQEDELLTLVEKISKIGREEDVKIIQISPIEDPKAKKISGYSKGDIYPVMINIYIHSGYHQLGRFINKLENLDQFLKVLFIDIKFDKQLYTTQVVHLTLGAFIVK